MKATATSRVNVGCIASSHEARAAIELGASALGSVGAMPSGTGVIADEQIRVIAAGVLPPVKELGGTGRVHACSLSRAIREQVDVPVFLAGGLRAENVRRAIDEVGPWGLDVCSGVLTDGQLGTHKLERFLRTAGVG